MSGKASTIAVKMDLDYLARVTFRIQDINNDILNLIDQAMIEAGLMNKYKNLVHRRDANTNIKDRIEQRIKLQVLNLGESVKATTLNAVFNKGKVSWNSDGLGGYAVAHPEIKEFRSVGDPYISLRQINQ